jgi:dTDP-4-dehydrorhamnose reductase
LKIAVVGRSGQLARALAEAAVASGVSASFVGRPDVDIASPSSVDVLAGLFSGCDAVINAAAYTAVDKAETDLPAALAVNAAGVAHVARAAVEAGAALVHVSTDYVFPGTLDRPYREDDKVFPLGAYGLSKLLGEQAAMLLHPRAVVLRTAWVYGPFGGNFVATMLRLGETRSEVGVVGDQFGAPTNACDLAEAAIEVARRLSTDSAAPLGCFHATGAGEASWADLAAATFAAAERHWRARVSVRRIPTSDYPTPARRPANSRLDNTKFREAFGFALPDWHSSLDKCVDRILGADKEINR